LLIITPDYTIPCHHFYWASINNQDTIDEYEVCCFSMYRNRNDSWESNFVLVYVWLKYIIIFSHQCGLLECYLLLRHKRDWLSGFKSKYIVRS
jgi:hypothetical protein